MEEIMVPENRLAAFSAHLIREEKSDATREKYLRDVRVFLTFAGSAPITKELVIDYKTSCVARGYAVRSVNSMLASVNSFLGFLGRADCRAKSIRQQRQTYCTADRELTKTEYLRLLEAANRQPQLRLVMQTICATGIRVSELRYFTLEAVQSGEISVHCKSKTRTILVPRKLRVLLLDFAKKRGIRAGAIFITRNGNPLNRSNGIRRSGADDAGNRQGGGGASDGYR